MLGSIKYNLLHLFDFRGRDARPTFWYYMLFLAIVQIVATLVVIIPPLIHLLHNLFAAARAGVTDPQAINDLKLNQINRMMHSLIPFSIGLRLAMIVLFVAAFVRRLRDCAKSGWWALLPVAAQLASIWPNYSRQRQMQAVMIAAIQHHRAYRFEFVYSGLVWLIGYILVIVFGVMKSSEGRDRHGEAPVEV